MAYIKRPLGLFFLVLMVIMGAQVALKSPLCINSSIVYRIDKIKAQQTETIYNCNQYEKVKFSNYFYDNLGLLQEQLDRLEVVFSQLRITDKINITIDDLNKNQTQELANAVRIGSDLLTGKQLGKMLIQLSLKNKLNIRDRIFLQSLADFLVDDGQYQNLISEAWNKSFNDLGFFGVFAKRSLTHIFIRKLLLDEGFLAADSDDAASKLKTLLATVKPTELSENFSTNFDKNLKERGYYSESELKTFFVEHKLDVVIELNDLVNLADLTALAKNHPELKFAIKNAEGMYLLPSNLKIPPALEKNMWTQYRLIFSDPKQTRTPVRQYLDNTESLVFIRSAKEKNKINFRPLFASGLKEFLFLNKQADFVQIHLPSYKLKSKDLRRVQSYFEFVKTKQLSKSEKQQNRTSGAKEYRTSGSEQYRALGWSQSEWVTELRAYRPIAHYDAIQYFRVN